MNWNGMKAICMCHAASAATKPVRHCCNDGYFSLFECFQVAIDQIDKLTCIILFSIAILATHSIH